jgi:hypothetical protein
MTHTLNSYPHPSPTPSPTPSLAPLIEETKRTDTLTSCHPLQGGAFLARILCKIRSISPHLPPPPPSPSLLLPPPPSSSFPRNKSARCALCVPLMLAVCICFYRKLSVKPSTGLRRVTRKDKNSPHTIQMKIIFIPAPPPPRHQTY